VTHEVRLSSVEQQGKQAHNIPTGREKSILIDYLRQLAYGDKSAVNVFSCRPLDNVFSSTQAKIFTAFMFDK
jgi:hypothetical protein